MSETTDREARAEETYARLFEPRDTSAPDNVPSSVGSSEPSSLATCSPLVT
jgi:hypothetical protein